ncbi:MAG: hypothetical protein CMP84_03180 [Gammaproteobacteria bacterium]|nr:hypothetical protein [Gammaproteobacteria bacterium]
MTSQHSIARKAMLAIGLVLLLVILAVWQRHLLLFTPWSNGTPPAFLNTQLELSPGSYWYDDYFLVEPIDSRTFAIGEPRYAQQNYSYLILGDERAILFDAGPGIRDIRPVTATLTDLPITFVPSHFHFDHIGNSVTFERVAVPDLPYLRARAVDNALALTWREHLGSTEGFAAPTLDVDDWLALDSVLELGDRSLRVIYTPGHTEDSISLLDLGSGAVFSGDFLYPGNLYAFMPTSNMGSYLQGAETLLELIEIGTPVYGAHRGPEPVIPRLGVNDMRDLHGALIRIRDKELDGEDTYPVFYPVNDKLDILAEPRVLQSW